MSIELVMPSSHLILCRPLLLLPSIFPTIRVFSSESALHIRCRKYWSFSFSVSPSNEHPGLISVRMDWLDLFAVQGTLKSLLQHHSSKASILRCSAFFMVQLICTWLLEKYFKEIWGFITHLGSRNRPGLHMADTFLIPYYVIPQGTQTRSFHVRFFSVIASLKLLYHFYLLFYHF